MLCLPFGVKDGSDGGECEWDDEEEERGDDARRCVQPLLRLVVVYVRRL